MPKVILFFLASYVMMCGDGLILKKDPFLDRTNIYDKDGKRVGYVKEWETRGRC